MVPASDLARNDMVLPLIELSGAECPPMLMLRSTFLIMLVSLGICVTLLGNAICPVPGGTREMPVLGLLTEDFSKGNPVQRHRARTSSPFQQAALLDSIDLKLKFNELCPQRPQDSALSRSKTGVGSGSRRRGLACDLL
jgi:hypothetical protein